MATKQTATKGKAVVVTTAHKGVFFGYMAAGEKDDQATIRLNQARMCVYWSENVHGVLGLASSGPLTGCRIGPAVPEIVLREVTAVMGCSDEAVAKWETGIWNR